MSVPEHIFQNEVTLIYGRPKAGKSSLSACYDNPYFLATEPGLKYLVKEGKITATQIGMCNDWGKIKHQITGIVKAVEGSTFPYQTLVFDTIDNALDYCNAAVCADNGITHPSELPMGKGWNKVTSEFKAQINRLTMIGLHLVLISHDKMLDIETRTEKYNKWSIALTGRNREAVLNMTDHIFFIDTETDKSTGKEERHLVVRGSKYIEAGTRNEKLVQAEGGKIALSYDELVKYF